MNAARELGPDLTMAGRGTRQIYGTGEMASLTRDYDWKKTRLGPVEQWPEVLLTTVNMILGTSQPMFLWWGEDLVQFYNDAYRPSIGSDKHPRALGQRGQDCWPEVWAVIGPQIQQVMATGEPTWHEDQLIPIYRDGRLEDVYWTYAYSPIRDMEGRICGTLVTCTDVTYKKVAEQNLRKELKGMADLFEQAPAFFAVLRGPQHRFELVNPRYRQLLGPREVIGKSVREAVPEVEDQGFIGILDTVYRTGEPFVGRNTRIKLARHGSEALEERNLDFVYQPMREADGTISGIIALGVDITEGMRAERVLVQTEKLAAVGRLASSIAHEINNPLESVTNLLYLARQETNNPETKQYLEAAEVELQRVAAITNQTLRFHRQNTRPQAVTAREILEGTVLLHKRQLMIRGVEVSTRERAVDPVVCFEGEIRQVMNNLVGNALDAMGSSGGRLLIRSRNGADWRTGRRGVIFTVADTGCGMTREVAANIFEAFFTTKEQSGTGLGLWVSRDIIQRHEGRLAVRSSQRKGCSGTVFTVFLPFEAASRSPEAASSQAH